MITWDERKRLKNRARQNVDFAGCEALFDAPVMCKDDDRMAYGEQRQNAIRWLNGRLVNMTYVDHGESFHVISLREATRYEIQEYTETFPHHES